MFIRRASAAGTGWFGMLAAATGRVQPEAGGDVLRTLADAAQLKAAARPGDPVARQLQFIIRRDADAALRVPATHFARSHSHKPGVRSTSTPET
jgi:hypothetical protein